MAVPWISLIDVALGLTDVVRRVRGSGDTKGRSLAASSTVVPRARDTRLPGVMMSALREAFDRDHERHELERQRAEDERQRAEDDRLRAERAMRLDALRQAGDREIGRLRLTVGVAISSVLASMLLATRLLSGVGGRVALGIGWLLLLVAIATSFAEQGRIGRLLMFSDDQLSPSRLASGNSGLVLWLIVGGLATIGLGLLIS